MKKEDLILGEIYRYDQSCIGCYGDESLLMTSSGIWSPIFNPAWSLKISPASEEDKAWYNACKKANTFIPKEKIVVEPIYEIY